MKTRYINIILLSFLMINTLLSCSLESYASKKIAADNEILSYMSDNNIDKQKASDTWSDAFCIHFTFDKFYVKMLLGEIDVQIWYTFSRLNN